MTTAPAQAAPGDTAEPTTAAEAAQLVADRGHQLEVLTEQFNDARVALEADQAAQTQAVADAQAAQAGFEAARSSVTSVARTAYQGGSQLVGLQTFLSASSAGEFVEQAATLDLLSAHSTEVLTQAQQANDAATAAQQEAEQATAQAQAQLDTVTAQQDQLNAEIAEYQAQYERLSAAERAAAEAAAAQAAERAGSVSRSSRDDGSSGSASSSSSGSSAAPAPSAGVVSGGSAAAQTAVQTALAQQGDPYVWAAAGPNSFDCSGLVQYAYAAAGISLPHSSRSQAAMGQAVSRSQLQPGDLVAFYSPVSHIGIYIGNGQMVHAPTSGDVVKVASIDAMGSAPTAYRRIAG
ncbi:NlpC/P60 family protein [Klenkia sp. PcliD-1-E]|uniref:C40 family peptidase n=1 Tax=Klenkia sp. PcliD-1-E TaxID=2954492 RepID=UPI0020977EB7|nr:C40 family peptidase [Klenkia sp. PcliD-1-E]MCO7218239.1 C40 family peptidase [Klenkia sp. PcliD-1-E]